MLKCHCACTSETGTCIINDAGRQAEHKKQRKYTFFLVESRQTTFYTHVMKVYINFQCKKKTFKKIIKLNDIIPLTNTAVYKVSKHNHSTKPTKTEHVFK